LVGALWIGQGVGWIGGSFMTGEAIWAVIGTVVVVFAIALVGKPRRQAGRHDD
jgi:hypothetical protein